MTWDAAHPDAAGPDAAGPDLADVEVSGPTQGAVGRRLRLVAARLVPAAQLVLWLYLYLVLVLCAWVGIGVGVGGWTPVVVTSGSMSPTVHPGDVLLVERDVGAIGQRSIIVFDRDGQRIAHRVFSVDDTTGTYVTKGDANPAPDADLVTSAEVFGVGRLLVPLVGLPVVWQEHGDLVPLGAWALVTLAGAGHMAAVAVKVLRRRGGDGGRAAPVAAAQVGIRRVRWLVALLIAAHYVLDPARFDVLGDDTKRVWMVSTALGVLAGTNLLSGRRRPDSAPGLTTVAELAIDSSLVILLATLTGTSGIGWVLFALPIIEAAVRFRLIGALSTWILLTGLTLVARVWAVQYTGAGGLLDEMEALLDQLSLLFLVVVPGAYLAEQLMNDVLIQQRATSRAVDRGALLESVAQAGFKVTRLGDEPVHAIVEGTVALGFDAVDVALSAATGVWRTVAAAGGAHLPVAGGAGSGLRTPDLHHEAVAVDRDDPDHAEVAALAAHDLSLVLAHTVSKQDHGRLVLRAGLGAGRHVTNDQIEAFRLLAGQATIALQNDDLVRQLRTTRDDLDHQAHHDALTGLPNRALLLKRAAAAMEVPGDRPALLFLDLNGFKPVNDRLGHEMGDVLLRLVGERLTHLAPDNCLVARLGGDEFTLLLTGRITEADAEALSATVWDRIREPFELNGDIVHISTSIGVAFGEPGMAHAELIRRADVAMYEAKHRSKDPALAAEDAERGRTMVYQVYRPDFDREEQRRAVLAAGIADALAGDDLRIDYQTIHHLEPGGGPGGAERRRVRPPVAGLEALLRWHHPELGDIGADEITEVARSTGLRDTLAWWVVNRVCGDAATWAGRHPDAEFFVSLDGWSDHGGRGLVDNLERAIALHGLDPGRLQVEMSEAVVASEQTTIGSTLQALRQLGVGVLLDDFGRGRTSLSQLPQLPLTGVKLDPALVSGVGGTGPEAEADRIVLDSIVGLCRRLGLAVVAQGIVDADQLGAVASLGCELGQGVALGYPELVEHAEASLASALRRGSAGPSTAPVRGGGA